MTYVIQRRTKGWFLRYRVVDRVSGLRDMFMESFLTYGGAARWIRRNTRQTEPARWIDVERTMP